MKITADNMEHIFTSLYSEDALAEDKEPMLSIRQAFTDERIMKRTLIGVRAVVATFPDDATLALVACLTTGLAVGIILGAALKDQEILEMEFGGDGGGDGK